MVQTSVYTCNNVNLDPWKQNGILSFINFILLLKNIYISYKHCIESNNKIND